MDKELRDDVGRNPDDGETLMNGDDTIDGIFQKQQHTPSAPTIRMQDGTVWGDPES